MSNNYGYAQVLINRNIGGLSKTYQYKVSVNLESSINIGSRVIVPFGNTYCDGFIVKLEKEAVGNEIKKIESCIESEFSLTEEMISTAYWMSEQYLCPLILCLRCFLPAQIASSMKKYYFCTNKKKEIDFENEKQKLLYEYIKKRTKVSHFSLTRKFGNIESLLKNLINKNVLSVDFSFANSPSVKKQKIVSLTDKKRAEENITSKAKKQKIIIDLLVQSGEISLKDLTLMAECSYSTIKNLQEKGIINVQEKEILNNVEHNFSETFGKELWAEQQEVFNSLENAVLKESVSRFLLHGITGSGKTEIYIKLVQKILTKGKQAVVLVPEITLTQSLAVEFKKVFGRNVALLHSRISDSEKNFYWRKIKEGKCNVVVGTRSAVFAPCFDIGLIIIDEEHEWTYKQEKAPKYHAREVAWKRVKQHKGHLLLGSATPSIETYWKALKSDLNLLEIKKRVFDRSLPDISIVDMKSEYKKANYSIFSLPLLNKLYNRIKEKNESIILLVNRRGYASFVLCKNCGFVFTCLNCNVSLTYHKNKDMLQCHYCFYKQLIPSNCHNCGNDNIRPHGIGTQKVEEEAKKLFSDKRVFRIDSDTVSQKGQAQRILEVFDKEGGILVGTQMIAKGLNFENVTLVGVIDADSTLNIPDFRSREKCFQLLTQVSGRAGRGIKKGEVVIQTYAPNDPGILSVQNHDYQEFYKFEIKERERFQYPPFIHLLRIIIIHGKEDMVKFASENIKKCLMHFVGDKYYNIITILGPAPSPVSKIKGQYRWQLIIKSKNLKFARTLLNNSLEKYFQEYGASVRVDVDINPLGIN